MKAAAKKRKFWGEGAAGAGSSAGAANIVNVSAGAAAGAGSGAVVAAGGKPDVDAGQCRMLDYCRYLSLSVQVMECDSGDCCVVSCLMTASRKRRGKPASDADVSVQVWHIWCGVG